MVTAAIAAPKISFETFAMNFFSASGYFVFDAQKIGLHCRKFHHAFLNVPISLTTDQQDREDGRKSFGGPRRREAAQRNKTLR
jgi:hypothetical protein